tara:strand:+ start:293 stop:523 length:231 start_codon:yes stop_codon:yes gene_type:complete
MSKIKNYVMDIQEQVWKFFDEDGNFVPTKVNYDGKMQTIATPKDLVNYFAGEHGLFAADIVKEEIFDITTADHFSQ